MAQFIDFEVEVSDTEKVEDDEDEVCSNNSLNSFINDSTSCDDEKTNEESFYRKFDNMETSVDEILKQEYDQSILGMSDIDLSNLCETSEEEGEIDEFKESEKRVDKFTETFFSNFEKQSKRYFTNRCNTF